MNHYCLRDYSILRLSNLKGPPPFANFKILYYSFLNFDQAIF